MAPSKPFQVNLSPEHHRQLRCLAERRAQSMGSLVRESVAEYLAGMPLEDDPLAGLPGMFEDTGARPHGDIGEGHDAYLAGLPERESSERKRPGSRRRTMPRP
jgi:hypothetical protein